MGCYGGVLGLMGYWWWVNDGLMRHLRGYDGDLIGRLMGFKRIPWHLMVMFISFPWLWRPCIKTGCHTRFSLCSHQRDADEDCTTSLVRWHFLVPSGVGPKQNVRHVRSIASVANRHCTEPCGWATPPLHQRHWLQWRQSRPTLDRWFAKVCRAKMGLARQTIWRKVWYCWAAWYLSPKYPINWISRP